MANYQSGDLKCFLPFHCEVEKTHAFTFWQKPTRHNPAKCVIIEYSSGRVCLTWEVE